MRNLKIQETSNVAGGVTIDHVGENIIITFSIEDHQTFQNQINFYGCCQPPPLLTHLAAILIDPPRPTKCILS